MADSTAENNQEYQDDENPPNLTVNISNVPQSDVDEASPRSFVASDSELNDERKENINETQLKSTSQIQTTNLTTKLTTSLSHHDRGKTVTNVQKIYQKGEQPKTDKYEIWAWYCYDC